MTDHHEWVAPSLEWRDPVDVAAIKARLDRDGELLVTWPAASFESHSTICVRLGHDGWICQTGVGAIQFAFDTPRLIAFPQRDGDHAWFREVVLRSWLPAIYPIWDRHVLHASAVARTDTLATVAFTGPSGAGKSTTAYGVARRPGWRLVGDDTLAFAPRDAESPPSIRLFPLRNDARLRPESAEFFGRAGLDWEAVEWPRGNVSLRAIYILDASDAGPAAEFTRLRLAEGLPRLLEQAYALSLELPKYNQQLMRDYAALAASIPIYQLRYRRAFSVADELYAAIDAHAISELGLGTAAPTERPRA